MTVGQEMMITAGCCDNKRGQEEEEKTRGGQVPSVEWKSEHVCVSNDMFSNPGCLVSPILCESSDSPFIPS